MERRMIEILVFLLLMIGFIYLLGIGCLYADFISWITAGRRHFDDVRKTSDKLVGIAGIFVLAYDFPNSYGCGWDWPVLAPSCGVPLYLLTIACMIAYLYSTIRKRLGPALPEIIVNFLLLIAVPVNILVGIQQKDVWSWVFCTIPLLMLTIMTLAGNYRLALEGVRNASSP
jgi:hypothetical protein